VVGCSLTSARDPNENLPATAGASTSPAGYWQTVVPGIGWRSATLSSGDQRQVDTVQVRLDPTYVTFRVHYSPGDPHWLHEWCDLFPKAVLIVNGGFFDESDQALGLLVSEGQSFGQSFSGFGGMFQVSGSDVRVRSLISDPYQGETLLQAVQAFPLLIETGGVLAAQGEGFDKRSQRTAVGQDRAGRIVFVIVPYSRLSLAELQQGLLTSDLDLNIALALDGGRSTGMILRTPSGDEFYPSLDRIPAVIAVYLPGAE
jgi:hypothetical protein